MCASIGVDPLASSKGFWSEMLGVGDFYYELGVQIVEVCMASSHRDEMSTLIHAKIGQNQLLFELPSSWANFSILQQC